MIPKIDLAGNKFGRLSVTSEWVRLGKAKFIWTCICDCGAVKHVLGNRLRSGHTRSCGCLHVETLIARNKASAGIKRVEHRKPRIRIYKKKVDGPGRGNPTHGATRYNAWTPEYRAWVSMKTRCSSKYTEREDYKNYYGRGIRICDRWLSNFENFLADLGPRPSSQHSIDRIDNNGNYEPANVRWATIIEQANNRRPKARSVA